MPTVRSSRYESSAPGYGSERERADLKTKTTLFKSDGDDICAYEAVSIMTTDGEKTIWDFLRYHNGNPEINTFFNMPYNAPIYTFGLYALGQKRDGDDDYSSTLLPKKALLCKDFLDSLKVREVGRFNKKVLTSVANTVGEIDRSFERESALYYDDVSETPIPKWLKAAETVDRAFDVLTSFYPGTTLNIVGSDYIVGRGK